MNKGALNLALVFAVAGAISIGCSSSDDSSGTDTGGTGGKGGSAATGGKGGASATGGKGGSTATGGTSTTGGTSATGGTNASGGKGGTSASGGKGGTTASGGSESAGAAGAQTGGEGGAAGAGPEHTYTPEMVARGTVIVRSMALCGGCHTASGGTELAGNPQFKGGALPAPNLTPDSTGIGDWSDDQIINVFRNGIDDEGRHLDPTMPYWLFHNMSDDDALAVVAFLRSLPKHSGEVGAANVEATPVTPLLPSAFPDSSLQVGDADYAAAQTGKYLVSGVAQCVKCHTPATAGLPSGSFFSGVPPAAVTTPATVFASNITPDTTTGIGGWSADDVATALKAGTNKAGGPLCSPMPSAAKGYGGMSDTDAHAIGVYLTTIPAVSKATAEPSLEPTTCP